jgi:hypothetical protein
VLSPGVLVMSHSTINLAREQERSFLFVILYFFSSFFYFIFQETFIRFKRIGGRLAFSIMFYLGMLWEDL